MMTPEEIAAEEARALEYRQQATRRVHYQTGLWQSLAGSPAARQALMDAWQPVIDWMAEREMPPVSNQDETDPLGMSDWVNVGR